MSKLARVKSTPKNAQEVDNRGIVTAKTGHKRERREQQRAIDTRLTILKAALSEFAEYGFEAASIRRIGERTGLQHPLITYHYRTKSILWQSVAEHVFMHLQTQWDARIPRDSKMTAIERVREEYRLQLHMTLEYPDFHHFMLRESKAGNPRLAWLVEKFVKPLSGRILRQIRAAQKDGDLPQVNPVLLHYMFIGMASVLSSLGAEISMISGLSPDDPGVVQAYWSLMEAAIFNKNLARVEKSRPRSTRARSA